MALPEAATKLRIVLDYLPCEPCLAQPVQDQELLCTVCARLHRQVAVRTATKTTVLVERPTPPEAPVVIPPAAPPEPGEAAKPDEGAPIVAPLPPREPVAPPAKPVVIRFADEPEPAGEVVDVVLEPIITLPPAPIVAAIPAPEPVPAAAEPEAEEPEFDDLVSFSGARDEFFDYKRPVESAAPAPEVAPEPEPAPTPPAATWEVEDDFVFRPPPKEQPAPRREEPVENIQPTEEIPVEREGEARDLWAPPPDFLAEEAAAETVETEVIEETPVEPELAPAPIPPADDVVEMELVEEAPEAEMIEMEVVQDEPVEAELVEMEMVEEEATAAAPSGHSDLYRLRGFDAHGEGALARAGITQLAHLSGHDAGELAERTQLPFDRVNDWIQVADLVQEVGVPIDAAIALVHAGIAGPRGLREAEPEEIVDRVTAFSGGYQVNEREVKRWKRRA